MTALVLDAGALIAVDRDDRRTAARLRAALDHGLELRTHPLVVAQVWRDGRRQARLARFLKAVAVVPIDGDLGRKAGVLCGTAGTSDPIDATLLLVARPGDTLLTGDPDDFGHLRDAAGPSVRIVSI